MSYKIANFYDADDMIHELKEVRDTVQIERAKRLEREKTQTLLPSFKSGQQHAKKRFK